MGGSSSVVEEMGSRGRGEAGRSLTRIARWATVERLLAVTAVLLAALGLAWIVAPEAMLASWGLGTDPGIVYMSRRYAVMFLPFAVILWMSRASVSRRPALVGALVGSAAMAVMSLTGVVTGTVSPAGLLSLGVEAILMVVFGWAVATGQGNA